MALAGAAVGEDTEASELAPRFAVPVICDVGARCFIQNYYDRDPGPQYSDHNAGTLTYDGHKGVDIRLSNIATMREGVPVVAAAPGVVRAVRNSMPDINFRDVDPELIEERQAGNSVVIQHGGGWESQYSHMMHGSITVTPGQRVHAGQVIGKVGLSGKTEFPHLHFAVRRHGKHLDPFTGLAAGETGEPRSLWTLEAHTALAYIPAAVLSSGFADEAPQAGMARDGGYAAPNLRDSAAMVVFWVDVFGLRAGDRERMQIVGPDGKVLVSSDRILEQDKAQNFRGLGKRRMTHEWPPGRYRGEYRLLRETGGAFSEVAGVTRVVEIR